MVIGIVRTIRRVSAQVVILVLLMACSPSEDKLAVVADIIFLGDNIVTMDDSEVNAVAVIGDRIAAVGDAEGILAMRGPATRLIELGARALLPYLDYCESINPQWFCTRP